MLLLVTLAERLAEIRVGAEVERRLALLVHRVQVGAVGGEEAGDGGARLLVRPRGAEPHQQLAGGDRGRGEEGGIGGDDRW